MKNIFFQKLFILSLFLNLGTSAQIFTGVEHLGCPTDNSIRLNIVSSTALHAYVKYGQSSGAYTYTTSTISESANEPIEFLIDNLENNTLYYYRLVFSDDGGVTWTEREEHSFQTKRTAGSTFTFTITTDSHINVGGLGNIEEWRQALNLIANDNPDLHLDLGDTFDMDYVSTAGVADDNYLFQRADNMMGIISHTVPIFLAPGNHENEEGWNFDDTNPQPIFGINARKRYFPNPIPDAFYSGNTDVAETRIIDDHLREDYYAWEWGDALFIVFDPFQYTMTNPYGATAGEGYDDPASGDRWNWTLGQSQYDWLKNVLENSDCKYKFMFAHHQVGGTQNYVRGGGEPAPWFEWGGNTVDRFNNNETREFNTKRRGMSDPIHELMKNNGVSAFFHGHDHQYVYEKRDGIVYQEVPSPSMGNSSGFNVYPNEGNYGDYQVIKKLPNSGYLRLTVSPTETIVEYVKTDDGSVAYTYIIEPKSFDIQLKVFLEGSYNYLSGIMGSELNSNGALETSALSQPYNSDPWNYNGGETVKATFFDDNPTITDWILVEIRNDLENPTTVKQRAGLLKNDGSIVDIDGINPLKFSEIEDGGYFIKIMHRNHLDIVSANAIEISDGALYNSAWVDSSILE